MGYCISATVPKFTIKNENKANAFAAIKALKGKGWQTGDWGSHFTWVSPAFFDRADTLEVMLRAWRWHAACDANGDITKLEFIGEKYGDDELLFTTIAPYVEPDSEIHFRGEDGDQWKYLFNGKNMREVKAKIVWEK